MNQQPPLPPEIGTAPVQPSKSDYVEIEIPANSVPLPQSRNNCLWGCGGMLGCMIIFVGLIGGTIFLGAESVINGFTGYFNLPSVNINLGAPGNIDIPENIYIPTVERIQTLSELTTTQYNYAEVTSGQRNMPAWLSTLYGDSVVMVVVGTVEAGIDVSQITEDDVLYDAETKILTVTLPAPVLQSCFLDESQSYIVRREIAAFADPMDNLEDTLRHQALTYYRDTALEEGILVDAENDARATLSELLSILVNDETVTINIVFDAPLLEPVLPASCQ